MYTGLYLWASFDVYGSLVMYQWVRCISETMNRSVTHMCAYVCFWLDFFGFVQNSLLYAWHKHACIHTYTNTPTQIHTHTCAHTSTHTYTRIHTHTNTQTHTHTHASTHEHTHTNTQKRKKTPALSISLSLALSMSIACLSHSHIGSIAFSMSIAFSRCLSHSHIGCGAFSMSIAFSYWVRRKFPLYRSLLLF